MIRSKDMFTGTESNRQSEYMQGLLLRRSVSADFAALSQAGKARHNNQDRYFVGQLGRMFETVLSNVPKPLLPMRVEERGYGMLVADGMGGEAAGEVASSMAVNLLLNFVISAGKWGRRIDKQEAREIVQRARQFMAQVHDALLKKGEAEPRLAGMGTTLTVAYSFGDELVIAHVGDSRAYLFRQSKIYQLTRDHTLVQQLVDAGYLSPKEAARHHFRHTLTNVLGGRSGSVKTDIEHFRLEDQDRLLLCSNGLTEMLDAAAISRVLGSTPDVNAACSRLIELALDAGSSDDITAVLAQYTIADSTIGKISPGF
jgi:PPM family protein phosphatase